MDRTSSRFLRPFVALVSVLGLFVLVGAAMSWHHEDMILLATLIVVVIACEVFDFVPIPNSTVSVSIVLIFAAGTLSGLPGVAVVAPLAAFASCVIHRKPIMKAAFNSGCLLLTGAAYVGVLEVFSPMYDSGDWTAMLGPALLGATLAFAVNSGLVTLVIALDTRKGPLAIWKEGFLGLLPHYVLLALLALFIANAYDRWDLRGIVLLAGPLAMAWVVMKQYTDRAPQPVAPRDTQG
jgi:hypothetical protein